MGSPDDSPKVINGAVILGLFVAAALGILRFVGSEPGERAVEWVGSNLVFAAAWATPSLLALLGLRGRPVLILAGGVLSITLAIWGAMSLLPLVLLVPGVLFVSGTARGSSPSFARTTSVVLLSLVLGWGAVVALDLRADPICWALVRGDEGSTYVQIPVEPHVRPTSITISSEDLPARTTASGCSSDSIGPLEGATSLTLVAATLGLAWILAPRPRTWAGARGAREEIRPRI